MIDDPAMNQRNCTSKFYSREKRYMNNLNYETKVILIKNN